jgi:hypothetical protein
MCPASLLSAPQIVVNCNDYEVTITDYTSGNSGGAQAVATVKTAATAPVTTTKVAALAREYNGHLEHAIVVEELPWMHEVMPKQGVNPQRQDHVWAHNGICPTTADQKKPDLPAYKRTFERMPLTHLLTEEQHEQWNEMAKRKHGYPSWIPTDPNKFKAAGNTDWLEKNIVKSGGKAVKSTVYKTFKPPLEVHPADPLAAAYSGTQGYTNSTVLTPELEQRLCELVPGLLQVPGQRKQNRGRTIYAYSVDNIEGVAKPHVGEFGVCVPPVGCLNPSVLDPTLLSGVAGQKADAGRPPSFLLVVEISYGAQKS